MHQDFTNYTQAITQFIRIWIFNVGLKLFLDETVGVGVILL